MSTNRLAEKLEMSKTEMSAFLTSDEQTFKKMGNSNYNYGFETFPENREGVTSMLQILCKNLFVTLGRKVSPI